MYISLQQPPSSLAVYTVQKQWQEQQDGQDGADSLDEEEAATLSELRSRRAQIVQAHRQKKALHGGNALLPRSRKHSATLADMQAGLESMGMDADAAVQRVRSASRQGRKRERSASLAARSGSAASHLSAGTGGDVVQAGRDGQRAAKRQHSGSSRSASRGVLQCMR